MTYIKQQWLFIQITTVLLLSLLFMAPSAVGQKVLNLDSSKQIDKPNRSRYGQPLVFQSLLEKMTQQQASRSKKRLDVSDTDSGLGDSRSKSQETRSDKAANVKAKIKDYCYREDVDGCSIPLGLPFFFKTQFTPPCDRHDICYHCGVGYAIDRLRCDDAFQANMKETCMDEASTFLTNTSSRFPSHTENSQEHKQKIQALIEDKNHILNEILKNVIDDMKKETGDVFRILLSPQIGLSLRRRVLLEWSLLLSQILNGGEHTDIKTHSTFASRKNPPSSVNDLYKQQMSINKDEYTNIPNDKFSASSNTFTETNDVSVHSEREKNYIQILEATDKVSTSLRKYRVSDYLSLEDIYLLDCLFFSELYYLAVRVFGYSSYHKSAEFFCDDGFVKTCLLPMV